MKVSLYMAISANGMIANKDDETPWSDAEWQSFNNKVKEVGNILIGRKTFELMKEDGSLDKLPCDLIMVLSSQKGKSNDKRVVLSHLYRRQLICLKSER